MPDRLLIADGVTLTYPSGRNGVIATYRVDFEVFADDSCIPLGPSGGGKSSLLKAVGGYLLTMEGRTSLSGRAIWAPALDHMTVFQQSDQLLRWRTVKQNVMLPMQATGKWNRAEANGRGDTVLAMVALAKFRDAYPHTLSGGMKQRAAIARGMAMEPAILPMVEPFAALGSVTPADIQDELLHLREQTGCTLLFVTHSFAETIKIGTGILQLCAHPGRVRTEISTTQRQLRELAGTKRLDAQIYGLLFGTQPNAAAALATSSKFGGSPLETLTGMLNPLPSIALLPLALLWFGIGKGSLLFVLLRAATWAVAMNTSTRFRGVSQVQRMVRYNYLLGRYRFIVPILIPPAFPSILIGLKTGWGFAWHTLAATQLIFGTSSGLVGLSWSIFENKNDLEIANLFAGLLTVILIGLLADNWLFRTVERCTVQRLGRQGR